MQFLNDLNLRHGQIEEHALQARNDAAHGNPLEPHDYEKTRDSYRALHTLVARVMLAVLDTDTRYFDYSTLGFPLRGLQTEQGMRSPRAL
jgi:hypothetical protein